MRKTKLNKLSKKIERLVKLHGKVELEVYAKNCGKYIKPHGLRYLYADGTCEIRYWTSYSGFKGRSKTESCFLDYSLYRNEYGNRLIVKSLTETLQAMQSHDYGFLRIKRIYVGKKVIDV